MKAIINKYYKTEDLQKYFKSKNYDQEAINEYLRHMEEWINDTESEFEDMSPAEIDKYKEEEFSELPEFINKCTDYYYRRREEGFSVEWSRRYAEKKIEWDTHSFFDDCYTASEKFSKDQAYNDLLLFCKLRNADQLYIDYMIEAINEGDLYSQPNVVDCAEKYSKSYKEQKQNGKSDIYAHQYAILMSYDNYDPRYIEDFAYAYDEAIAKGKSIKYAQTYADKYGSELINVKARYGISDDKEMIDFAIRKVNAYINGWEYATNNDIKEKSRFIEIYEKAYMNTWYSDSPNEWNTIEECAEISLRRAIEEYQGRN